MERQEWCWKVNMMLFEEIVAKLGAVRNALRNGVRTRVRGEMFQDGSFLRLGEVSSL